MIKWQRFWNKFLETWVFYTVMLENKNKIDRNIYKIQSNFCKETSQR